jgi:hypothetical protein
MAKKRFSARVFEGWLTAPEVAARILRLGGHHNSISALADRLAVGLVGAAATHRAIDQGEPEDGPLLIPREHWKVQGVAVDDVWQTGQFTVWWGGYQKQRFDYYGVRFDPVGIEAMLVSAGKGRAGPAPQEARASQQPERYERKRHVTAQQMQAWHAAFKAVYGGTARDVVAPFGLDSARGFFQDKEVSRDDVRKAMAADGPRPRGPKIIKS